MILLGKVIKKDSELNVYYIHIGNGCIKYFKSDKDIQINDTVIYSYTGYQCLPDTKEIDTSNEVYFVDNLSSYTWIGELSDHYLYSDFCLDKNYPNKVLAFINYFVIWNKEDYHSDTEINVFGEYLLFTQYSFNTKNTIDKEYFASQLLKVKDYVEHLDILKRINDYKVEVKNHFITKRGSDNYVISWTNIESEDYYRYNSTGDDFIENLFPEVKIPLYKYNEKDESEVISKDYPNKKNWDKEALLIERKIKSDALEYYLSKYDSTEHIAYLLYKDISNKYRADYIKQFKLLTIIKSATIVWSTTLINLNKCTLNKIDNNTQLYTSYSELLKNLLKEEGFSYPE